MAGTESEIPYPSKGSCMTIEFLAWYRRNVVGFHISNHLPNPTKIAKWLMPTGRANAFLMLIRLPSQILIDAEQLPSKRFALCAYVSVRSAALILFTSLAVSKGGKTCKCLKFSHLLSLLRISVNSSRSPKCQSFGRISDVRSTRYKWIPWYGKSAELFLNRIESTFPFFTQAGQTFKNWKSRGGHCRMSDELRVMLSTAGQAGSEETRK